jgi:hypothetical protein
MEIDLIDIENSENKTIPVFLKVLCILTFVGTGIGILSGIYSTLTYSSSLAQMNTLQNSPFMGEMSEFIELNRKYGFIVQLMALFGNILCLVGALIMWKLKKYGFYMYVVGQIIPLIGSYGLMGGLSASGSMFGSIAVFATIVGTMFPLAFVVMYALNLKHMK